MAEQETKSWTFLKGVGGVAGTVLAALLIYYFTRPKPVPPAPVLPEIGLNGFVTDAAPGKAISNALITVGLGPVIIQQTSDSMGRYAFVLTSDGPQTKIIAVNVLASGYKYEQHTIDLPPGNHYAELAIQPDVPPPAAPGGAAGVPAAGAPASGEAAPAGGGAVAGGPLLVHPGVVLRDPPPSYQIRASVERAKH